MTRPRRALSTGQAAGLCFVTADTVANWIRSGLLTAQRTAGGQYRIRKEDLREFMVSRGMDVEALDGTGIERRPCWEFRARSAEVGADPAAVCDGCIVRYLQVLDCFKLMAMKPGEGRHGHDCAECAYYKRYGGAEREA